MTWTWKIPLDEKPGKLLRPPLIDAQRLRAVVPTFRDWEEARMTIESLLDCRPRPAQIVLVNDNDEPGAPAWARRCRHITLLGCGENRGPAYARNLGANHTSELAIDWLYFTDTACQRDTRFFAALIDASMDMPRTTVAVAAPVRGAATTPIATPINYYMSEEAILHPPRDEHGPQALITANATVSMAAFRAVGGFDTTYHFAAGEDLDLGIRLRRLGPIGWAEGAVIYHRFAESLDDFRRRFARYGAGNAHLELRLGLPSMRVVAAVTGDPFLQPLMDAQIAAMQEGYDRRRALL